MTNELYVIVDIETDGQIPGDSSMLTLGAVPVTLEDGAINLTLDDDKCFYTKLYQLDGAAGDEKTLAWWAKQDPLARHEAFEAKVGRLHPHTAMNYFQSWCTRQLDDNHADKAVFVARPTGFDFSFVRWYMIHFLGNDKPFGHRALDMRSMLFGQDMSRAFSDLDSSEMDARFMIEVEGLTFRPHHALDDARHHALVFANMLFGGIDAYASFEDRDLKRQELNRLNDEAAKQ